MKIQFSRVLPWLKIIIGVILISIFVGQLVSNLSRGYLIIPPFKLDSPIVFETFHSNIKSLKISYPKEWRAKDLPQGNHGDKEVIASIRAPYYDYPYVIIAYRTIPESSLEKAAAWGESRIKANYNRSLSYESYYLDHIDINGREALLRTYSYLSTTPIIRSQERINCYHTYTLDGHDAYTIEMCVDERNYSDEMRALFEKMIKSVSFD